MGLNDRLTLGLAWLLVVILVLLTLRLAVRLSAHWVRRQYQRQFFTIHVDKPAIWQIHTGDEVTLTQGNRRITLRVGVVDYEHDALLGEFVDLQNT